MREYTLVQGLRPNSLPYYFPLSHHHFLTAYQPAPPSKISSFLTREMANQSGSVSFQNLLESALQRYEKKTGVTLSKHPIASQLQSCNSIEDFNKLLQDKAKHVKESERITKSMKTIVSILTPLSFVSSLPDAVGLVRSKALVIASYSDLSYRRFHLRKPYRLVSVSYSMYVPFSGLYVDFLLTLK